MDASRTDYLVVAFATYFLTALTLLFYKAAINDLNLSSRGGTYRELRSVHPLALLAGFTSVVPLALVRIEVDPQWLTLTLIAISAGYFLSTLLYRRFMHYKLIDFSIDTGSNFNDEVSADPTPAQKIWLFLVSWAGAIVFGVIYGLIVGYNSWSGNSSWLREVPGESEARIYLYIFIGVLLGSWFILAVLHMRRYRKLPSTVRLRKAINGSWVVPAIFGIMIASLQVFTRNTVFTNRYWIVLIFSVMVLQSLWHLVFDLPNLNNFVKKERVVYQQRVREERKRKRKNRRKRR